VSDPAPAAPPAPATLRPLDPRAITLWRLTMATRGAVFLVLAIAAELLIDVGRAGLLAGPVAVVTIAAVVVAPPLFYDAWRFALREEHLFLRRGLLFRTTSIVPYSRIQHVDTRHGPLDRWLGLASLVVFTAGTRGAIITVPALEAAEAETLRDRLVALSGAGDAV
jgi:uncharacterized protein